MTAKTKLAIAADHAGFELKKFLIENLSDIEWIDLGPSNKDRVDFPDYAAKLAQKVALNSPSLGVLVCGSGIGMSIAANKVSGIRAAVVESEIAARLSKEHNNANILCLGARILAPEYAKEIVRAWLNATFEGGRHSGRIEKITDLESGAAHGKNSKP